MSAFVDLVPAARRREDASPALPPAELSAGPSAAELPTGELPAAVLALADAEAEAAADALHDGALQALVVARYAADAAVRGGDPALTRDAVQSALVALRHAVWLLRPRGAQGLRTALEQLAAHLDETGRAPLHLDVDDAAATALDAELAPSAASAAYRLVQSAAGHSPLAVVVRRTCTGVRVALDAAVADPAGESLRARAAGGTLLATRDSTSLHLPLSTTTACSPSAFVPAPRSAPHTENLSVRPLSHRSEVTP